MTTICSTPVRSSPARTLPLLALFAVLALLPLEVFADVIEVPADYDKLQDAVDAAVAGDVIAITASGLYAGVTIDKPLTLVGSASNPPTIRYGPGTPWVAESCITLQTAGRVVLANLELIPFGGLSPANNPTAVSGWADELLVVGCTIRQEGYSTGWLDANPALSLWAVPNAVIADCEVTGGEFEHCCEPVEFGGTMPNSAPGLVCSTVCSVFDSVVTGGAGPSVKALLTTSGWSCGDPGGESGAAATGLSELTIAGSSFVAGAAGQTQLWDPSTQSQVGVCVLPVVSEAVQVTSMTELTGDTLVFSSAKLVAGDAFSVHANAQGRALLLTGPPDVLAPEVGHAGALYLDADEMHVRAIDASSPLILDVTLPTFSQDDWGTVIGAQLYSPAMGLSRPDFAVILPP